MFDHAAKRAFVARRGRNNRILFRCIARNVFDEPQEDLPKFSNPNKGQRDYIEKYNKIWTLGSKRTRAPSDSTRGRKRTKFSNMEVLLEEHPHLLKYAAQRSVEQIGPNVFKRHFKKLSELDAKQLAKEAGVTQKYFKEPKQVQAPSVNEASGEFSYLAPDEDDHASITQLQETTKLATYDFVTRHRSARREFLLSHCAAEQKSGGQSFESSEEEAEEVNPLQI